MTTILLHLQIANSYKNWIVILVGRQLVIEKLKEALELSKVKKSNDFDENS